MDEGDGAKVMEPESRIDGIKWDLFYSPSTHTITHTLYRWKVGLLLAGLLLPSTNMRCYHVNKYKLVDLFHGYSLGQMISDKLNETHRMLHSPTIILLSW